MNKNLVCCSNCGKMFKCTKDNDKYITDFGDIITDTCISCNSKNLTIMETADWIADLVFIVKGEKH